MKKSQKKRLLTMKQCYAYVRKQQPIVLQKQSIGIKLFLRDRLKHSKETMEQSIAKATHNSDLSPSRLSRLPPSHPRHLQARLLGHPRRSRGRRSHPRRSRRRRRSHLCGPPPSARRA
jgi:hypothetical protein